MWRKLSIAALLSLLAGCVQLPPTPQDLQAKKFESVPDKAVIYIVRNNLDLSSFGGTVSLDDAATITTYPGTYYRWEVAPGAHEIAGFANDNAMITLRTEAGKIYFVQHKVGGFRSPDSSFLQVINDRDGRAIVMRSRLIGS